MWRYARYHDVGKKGGELEIDASGRGFQIARKETDTEGTGGLFVGGGIMKASLSCRKNVDSSQVEERECV